MSIRTSPPLHPGEILREHVLPALGHSIATAADELSVSRSRLAHVIHERTTLSCEMAIRIEKWLRNIPGGGTADQWISLQTAFDLWRAREKGIIGVQRLPDSAFRFR
ncbi:addiction module antidote protein, HigA family [Paraburkholderia tropica]|nr:HigA family addiction module antitoxin [Paraburkholderia tropica]RQN38545.1 addiction module antidote protein, HigA family [Paraburkholderia tropica]